MIDESTYHSFVVEDSAVHPTTRKIQEFGERKKGWRWGEGVAFEQSILGSAIALNLEAIRFGFFTTDAFPGTDGSIMVTIYHRDQYLEFTIEPNGQVTFYHEQANEEVSYTEGLSLEEARTKIGEFSKQWIIGYGFSEGKMITTGTFDDSSLKPLSQEMTARYLSLAGSAYFKPAIASVSISQNFIPISRMTRRFFGASQWKYCLLAAS